MQNPNIQKVQSRKVRFCHRIINDRIEKSIKGRQIGHTGERGRPLLCITTTVVMLAGLVLPWCTLRPPPFPMPGRVWGTHVVCGCCRAGTTATANALMQIVPNSSALYTLLYSVIYNSVHFAYFQTEGTLSESSK